MDVLYPGFGRIVVEGKSYDHDVVIEKGQVRPRDKRPSKPLKARYRHTPLSSGEDLPWSGSGLIVGSGYSGQLQVTPDVTQEATRRGVELTVMPTAQAVELLADIDSGEVNAVLHVTC